MTQEQQAPQGFKLPKFNVDPARPIQEQATEYFEEQMTKIVTMNMDRIRQTFMGFLGERIQYEKEERGIGKETTFEVPQSLVDDARFDFLLLQFANMASADAAQMIGQVIQASMPKIHMPKGFGL